MGKGKRVRTVRAKKEQQASARVEPSTEDYDVLHALVHRRLDELKRRMAADPSSVDATTHEEYHALDRVHTFLFADNGLDSDGAA